MSNLSSSIKKSSIWVIARTIIAASLGIFVTAYIVRTLTVEDYGTFNVLYSLMGYIGILGAFGIPAVFQRFIPEGFQKRDYSLVKKLVLRGLVLRVFLSMAIIGLVFLFSETIGKILHIQNWIGYFGVFSIGIIIYLEIGLLTAALHSLFLHKYSVVANVAYLLFRAAVVFALLSSGLRLTGLLWAEVVAWAFWMVLLGYFYRAKFCKIHPETTAAEFPTKRFFRYGGYSFFNEMGNSVLSVSTDFFVISSFLGPAAVGIYAFADRILKMLTNCMPHVVLIDVIRPTFFTKYSETRDMQHLSDMFNLLTKIGGFSVFPLVVTLVVLGDKVILHVFGPKYLDAYPILVVMAIFTAINIFTSPTGLVLQSIERNEINLYSKVFAVYNLVVEILIINKYGILGVSIVTCTAVFFKNYFCYYYARKYSKLELDFKGIFSAIINAILLGTFLYIARDLIASVYMLILVICIGIIVYLFICYKNKIFTAQESTQINNLLPRRYFVF